MDLPVATFVQLAKKGIEVAGSFRAVARFAQPMDVWRGALARCRTSLKDKGFLGHGWGWEARWEQLEGRAWAVMAHEHSGGFDLLGRIILRGRNHFASKDGFELGTRYGAGAKEAGLRPGQFDDG